MNTLKGFNKITIALIIGFLSINVGIGVSNAAMQKIKDYFHGDPTKQVVVCLSTSYGSKAISPGIIVESINKIKDNSKIIIGPYILSEKSGDNKQKEIETYFINNKFNNSMRLVNGKFLNNSNIEDGEYIVLGEQATKRYKDDIENNMISIRMNNYKVVGTVASEFERERVNNSMFLSINDFCKVITEPYISKEPFYLEIVIEGSNAQENANQIVNSINELKDDTVVNMELRSESLDFKEDINPSSYIIMGFSILILLITIINIWLLTSVIIEQNFSNFAIRKALGASEKMIAIDFIKQILGKIVIASVSGYITFLVAKKILEVTTGIYVYNNINNILITVIVCILTTLITVIRPYYKIRKMDLVKFVKL